MIIYDNTLSYMMIWYMIIYDDIGEAKAYASLLSCVVIWGVLPKSIHSDLIC